VNGTTTSYKYDVLASLPVVIQDGTYSYVYGLDLISMTDSGGSQKYLSYDGLGSVTDITDGSGTVTDTFVYDVFGAVTARTGTSASIGKFTGEQADDGTGDSGYYFLRARYYDPLTGRFVGRDKLEFSQRYAYAGSNPALLTDPSGRCQGEGDFTPCYTLDPRELQTELSGDDPLTSWVLQPTVSPACGSAGLGVAGVAVAPVPYVGLVLSRSLFALALAVELSDRDLLGASVDAAATIGGTLEHASAGAVKTAGARIGLAGLVFSAGQCAFGGAR
jgi:RHS repeat-associated protein